MAHYICAGTCGGSSDIPGVCEAKECERHGEELKECSCKNGFHRDDEKKRKEQFPYESQ